MYSLFVITKSVRVVKFIAECPNGWWYYDQGYCYYVSTNAKTQRNARRSCHSINAELTSINDERELNFTLHIS